MEAERRTAEEVRGRRRGREMADGWTGAGREGGRERWMDGGRDG